jgi:uncharacterized protein (TIGR03435 family)
MARCRPIAGVLALALALGTLFAQTAAPPAFVVASVKALAGAKHGEAFEITPDGVNFRGSGLGFLIRWAYGLHPYQSYETVGPAWLEPGLGCVWFSVIAKADRPVPVEQLRLMLRTLLAERLKLSLHRETRDMPVYVLSVAPGGPKFHQSAKHGDDRARQSGSNAALPVMEFEGASMRGLTEVLGQQLYSLLVDETGLPGTYDFTFDESRYQDYVSGPDAMGRAVMDGAISRALQDIRLKLETKRRPVEVLVIDHAEKTPVEN